MSEFAEPGNRHDGQVLLVIRFSPGPTATSECRRTSPKSPLRNP